MQKQLTDRDSEPLMMPIGRASEYLGVSIDTLRRWEKKGRIEARRSPGGHRYFMRVELNRLFDKKYTRDEPAKKREMQKKLETVRDVEIKDQNVKIISDLFEPEFAEEKLLDRPVRIFEIPEQKPVMIKFETKQQESYISYSEEIPGSQTPSIPQETSILIPQITTQPAPQIKVDQPVQPSEPPQTVANSIKNENQLKFTKKEVVIIITTLAVITTCFAVLLFFSSRPEMLSPIPD